VSVTPTLASGARGERNNNNNTKTEIVIYHTPCV